MTDLLLKITAGQDLQADEARALAQILLAENSSDDYKEELLTALAAKGESAVELATLVLEFLQRARKIPIPPEWRSQPLFDCCGTGGDGLDMFNVSTAAALVIAAAGVRVVKHGNRGITSKSGGADVLQALGVATNLDENQIVEHLAKYNFAFIFAPNFHPAFKAIAPVRMKMAKKGKRSLFNLIGPLLNPARPSHQLLGIYDPARLELFAEILQGLGRQAAWVVNGVAGAKTMDELSILGASHGAGFLAGSQKINKITLDAAEFNFSAAKLADLRGGDAEENARLLEQILRGNGSQALSDAVAFNAAAGLLICDMCVDLPAGLKQAHEIIKNGTAAKLLEKLR